MGKVIPEYLLPKLPSRSTPPCVHYPPNTRPFVDHGWKWDQMIMALITMASLVAAIYSLYEATHPVIDSEIAIDRCD